jgi:hypothetical protein
MFSVMHKRYGLGALAGFRRGFPIKFEGIQFENDGNGA